jgi:drug/metabolite transporter (DMT)-like permease
VNAAAVRPDRSATTSLRDRRIALILMSCFAVIWAVLEDELGVRLRQPYDLTQVVWCRYASHLVVVALVWGWRAPRTFWRTSRLGLQVGRSLLMIVMPMGFMFAAMTGTPVSTVWAVFWIAPLLIMIGAHLYGAEQAPRWLWILTTLAALAAIAVVHPTGIPTLGGLAWAVAMSASFAFYVVLTRALRTEALSANLFYTAIGVLIPLSVWVPRVWLTPSTHDAAILFGIGALGFVALLALDRAAERSPVSWTAGVVTLQVVAVIGINLTRHTAFISRSVVLGVVGVLACAVGLWVGAGRNLKGADS